MLVDTHVHLNHDDLHADLPAVLERARATGVDAFVVIGYDLASSARAVALAESDASLWAVVGIHPHDAERWSAEAARQLRQWSEHPRVVAVGEIGLDFYRDLSPREAQYRAFAGQLSLARAARLPVVIHCRDAYDETLDVLETEAGDTGVVLHCFGGEMRHAERAWARGWRLGIGGSVTFKNNDPLRAIVRAAPPESLLLETDAPYLSPMPLRGKYPNEPARVALVAEKVAEVRGEAVADVAAWTAKNARDLFHRMG